MGDIDKITISSNPMFFDKKTEDGKFFEENPGLWEIQLLKNPHYLAYTAWTLCGIRLLPFQSAILYELWTHSFPIFIAGRGLGKTWCLALYAILRALLFPEYQVVIAGASFRQSKMVFDYIETIWANSSVLRSVCDSRSESRKDTDKWEFKINGSRIIAIPIGPTGDKVRGLRANTVLIDEMAAHNPQIVEEVIFGFMSVKNDPSQGVVEEFRKSYLGDLVEEIDSETDLLTGNYKNQGIITGTADYYFNHFYDYWQRYKKIIESRGNINKLREIFPDGIPSAFDYKDYCIVRMPCSMAPKGFMDDATLARAKSSMVRSLYNKEFEAVFVEDSDGFFRRTLIESCVASDKNIEKYGDKWVPWCSTPFSANTRGNPNGTYVYGVDPASEVDNFAIIVLEVFDDHQRVVYCWTTNKKNFSDRRRNRSTSIDDYYHFCARKIRDLMNVFPCSAIGIDMQGGGIAICEALHDRDKMNEGEQQIWLTIDHDKPKESDRFSGLHIIHDIQFANAQWTAEANWGLKKDLEDKTFLFPMFDLLSIDISVEQDKMRSVQFEKENPGKTITLYDSLEDCILEIEELKDELTSIIHTRTGSHTNSRERWSVPQIIADNKKKIGGRKDRYSALIIANSIARQTTRKKNYDLNKDVQGVTGGLIRNIDRAPTGQNYFAPEWFDASQL